MSTSILVVEDENIVAKDVVNRLKNLGYTVTGTVPSGEEAVRAALLNPPDLVMMDIMLRGNMDGIEAARRILQNVDIPVVYLTAYADERTLARAKVTEAFGYLLKPFEERELHITIEMALFKHQMERKLRDSEQWLSAILQSIADAVIATDTAGHIRLLNTVAATLTGWTQAEAEGKLLTEVVNVTDEQARARIAHALLERPGNGGNNGATTRTTLIARNGREISIEENLAPIRNAAGETTGVVLVFRDVTEREKLEEQLRQAQKMESIGTLSSSIAHDFNNVLNNILGFASQLKKNIQDETKVRRYIDTIEKSANRGADLSSQLLSFARTGRRANVPTNLYQIIGEVIASCRETFPAAVKLESRVAPDLLPALGDHGGLYQVLLNLCVNARDAIIARPDGTGILTIEAHNAAIGKDVNARLFAGPGNRCVEVKVSDTGTGIPESIRGKIFDPFFTTKDRGQGTGLGLSIVYNIVRSHQGTIMLESQEGVGTTFKILLPALQEEPPEAPSEGPHVEGAVTGAARKQSILLVDDESTMQELGRELLEEQGYNVTVATNGLEALEIYRERHNSIDLVVLDLLMPGMDGGETYTEMKKINNNVKAFFCTGFVTDQIIAGLLQEQKLQAISKPFRPSDFLKKVREVMSSEAPVAKE